MKKFILLLLFLTICLTQTAVASATTPNKSPNPGVDAMSAILMDYETGRVLWEKNSDKPMAMASTTKIMTAIITLENGDLNDTVTVSKRASLAPEVNMDLREGEEIKLEVLLYALMLQSSNDAAVAIAEHVGGTVEDFCDMMTKKAKELGAKDTLFVTPNGLDSGDHHSTAYDMALIARYALSIPRFIEIINTPSLTATSSKNTHYISNKNRLLNEFQGATGVKTGFTNKAGHCFVGSAKREDMQLISVVLASGWGAKGREQKWVDTKEILKYGFDSFKYYDIIHEGDNAGSLTVERSKTPSVAFHYGDGLVMALSEDEKSKISITEEYSEIVRAPLQEGETVGTARVFLKDQLVSEIPLIASTGALRHDLKTSCEKILKEFFEMGTCSDLEIILPEF